MHSTHDPSAPEHTEPDTRLARRLGLGDAIALGLGSMLGAGVFVAFAPAADAAASPRALLLAVALAGLVAYANANSSARLAAVFPESGGSYVYGRRQLGWTWGYLAGWGFIVGKVASCIAAALTFGHYVVPDHPNLAASAAAAVLTIVNYFGIHRTAGMTKVLLVLVLMALTTAVAFAWTGHDDGGLAPLWSGEVDLRNVLQAAAICFFAFAGYARIATLGEEVRDPARTIPRAVLVALAIAIAIYCTVAATLLATIGIDELADSAQPLRAASAGAPDWATVAITTGAGLAALGVLLNLLAGISRTTFAMAGERDLPRWLSAVHPRHRIPHHAELTTGAIVTVLAAVTDVRSAITFSAFTILLYYAVANASALRLSNASRATRLLAAFGFVGCIVLASSLPPVSVALGVGILLTGLLVNRLVRRIDA